MSVLVLRFGPGRLECRKELNMLRRPAIQFCLSLTFAWLLSVGVSHGAEWVTLKGRFVYDGEPPKTEFLTPNRDVDMCGKKPIPVNLPHPIWTKNGAPGAPRGANMEPKCEQNLMKQ